MTLGDLDLSDLRPSDIRAIGRSLGDPSSVRKLQRDVSRHIDQLRASKLTEARLEEAFVLGAQIATAFGSGRTTFHRDAFFLFSEDNPVGKAFGYGFAGRSFLDLLTDLAQVSRTPAPRAGVRMRRAEEGRRVRAPAPSRPMEAVDPAEPDPPFARLAKAGGVFAEAEPEAEGRARPSRRTPGRDREG